MAVRIAIEPWPDVRLTSDTEADIGENSLDGGHIILRYQRRPWSHRFNELRRRGVPKFGAAVAAGSPTGFWRMSGHPAVQQALRNHYFDSLGLPRLHVSAQA